MKPLLFALALAAGPLAAQTPMTASEFEAYVEGRTLTFFSNGLPYGAERYLANRRVVWSFVEGQEVAECADGIWYPRGEAICFEYVGGDRPQCWLFFEQVDGLRAEYVTDPGDITLYEARDRDGPLLCEGPDVGA